MADSASDPKVEDVLSSVRRLVSSEIPRKARAPIPEGPGALVLTPADRIERDPAARASRSLEDRIAELEAAVDSQSEEFEPDGSEDQSQNVPDRIVYTRPPTSSEEAEMRRSTLRLSEIALIETSPADDSDEAETSAPVAFRHDRSKSMTTPHEERGVGDNGGPSIEDRPEPETVSDADEAPMDVDVPPAPPRSAEVRAFSNPDDVVERIEARIDRGEQDVPEIPIAVPSGQDSADTVDEAHENMLREDLSDADPDDTDARPEDEFESALNDAVEASISSAVFDEIANSGILDDAPADETETTSPDSDAGAATETSESDDLALEQDELQALVGRMIREELKGQLGEQITRNVRKLVRREIKRALEARDLI